MCVCVHVFVWVCLKNFGISLLYSFFEKLQKFYLNFEKTQDTKIISSHFRRLTRNFELKFGLKSEPQSRLPKPV